MEVELLNTTVFDIPPARRVGAIVHDGASDLRLWPGPGADRALGQAYGPDLARVLDERRKQLGVDALALGEVTRIYPGRLHCDFLVWVATRGPEPGAERQPAPSADLRAKAVREALAFAAERDVARVAFCALGDGPGAAPADERLALVVQTVHAYQEWCFAEGRPPVVEEVLVCERDPAIVRETRRRLVGLLRPAAPPPPAAPDRSPASGRRRAAGSPARTRRKSSPPTLDPTEVARARSSAEAYDRARTYEAGQWLLHPRFGVGCVLRITPEQHLDVLFEDGAQRKMLHAQA